MRNIEEIKCPACGYRWVNEPDITEGIDWAFVFGYDFLGGCGMVTDFEFWLWQWYTNQHQKEDVHHIY
jgi:hypothetical protein